MIDYFRMLRFKMRSAVTEVNKASARFKEVDDRIAREFAGDAGDLRIARKDSLERKDAINAWDHWCAEATMWAGVITAEAVLRGAEDDPLPVSQ